MGGSGILLGESARVEGVRAVANGPHAYVGVGAGLYSRIVGNIANNNVGSVAEEAPAGIFCDGCLISGNIANHNYKGIVSGSSSLVFGNSASGNVYGLDLNIEAGYGKNVMENNRIACVNPVDGGASMGDNICNGVLE
jgi:parallel beta-helix repeat protein